MKLVLWAYMALLPALTALGRWYRSHDVDVWEGGMPPSRWLVWGTVRCGRPHSPKPEWDMRYFKLQLPSYSWERIYGRNQYGWCRLTFWRFNGRWNRQWWPVQ